MIPLVVAFFESPYACAGTTPSWNDIQNKGDQAQVNGELLEAAARFQQAADLAKTNYGVKSPQYLKSIIRLTAVLVLNGQCDKAEPYYKQIMDLNLTKGKNGLIDPEVGVWVDDLGDTYFSRRNPKIREICLKHGLDIKTRIHGSENKYLGIYLNGLFDYYFNAGRYTEALPYALKRLRMIDANKQPDDRALAFALTAVASTYFKLKQFREAEATTTRLVNVARKMGPRFIIELSLITQLKGYIQLSAGELDRAQATFQELTKIGSPDPKVFSLGRVQGWQGLGDVSEKKHDDKAAEQYYRRALGGVRAGLGADNKEQLVPLHSLIVLLRKEGNASEASALEKQSNAIVANGKGFVSTVFPPYERE
jgi:tetratricopeptide (TPR) repeat protein